MRSDKTLNVNDEGRVKTVQTGKITVIGAGNRRVRIDPSTGDVYKDGVLVAKGPRR